MAPRPRPDVERLACDLYASLLDGEGFEPWLRSAADAVGASRAIVVRSPRPGTSGSASVLASVNFDPTVVSDYQTTWWRQDPWAVASLPRPSGIVHTAELISPNAVRRTAYWNDFLRDRQPHLHGIALLIREPGIDAFVTFWRDDAADEFAAASGRLFATLAPHLRRALVTESALAGSRLEHAVLDQMTQGVLLIALDGSVSFVNRSLRAMTAQCDGLALARDGLRATFAAAQQRLERTVGLALVAVRERRAVPGRSAPIHAPRMSGRLPWRMEVVPMPVGTGRAEDGLGGVAVFVTDEAARIAPSAERIRLALSLAPAEAELAASLARGMTIAQHAEQASISIATARTHLARAMAKLECHRQSELVARVVAATA